MKRIIIITVLLATISLITHRAGAQSKMTEEQKKEAKARYEAYKQKLDLTEEQSKKVDAINTVFFEGLAGLKNSDASKLSKYKKYKALRNEKDKQMKEVLTKEQFKTYKAYQAEMKEEFRKNRD
jgi:Spy/CpxP family protein refolding chaperone